MDTGGRREKGRRARGKEAEGGGMERGKQTMHKEKGMKEGGEEGEGNERICFLVLSFTDHSCYLFSTPTQPHTQPHQTPTVNHLGVEEVHLARQPLIAGAHQGSAVL